MLSLFYSGIIRLPKGNFLSFVICQSYFVYKFVLQVNILSIGTPVLIQRPRSKCYCCKTPPKNGKPEIRSTKRAKPPNYIIYYINMDNMVNGTAPEPESTASRVSTTTKRARSRRYREVARPKL